MIAFVMACAGSDAVQADDTAIEPLPWTFETTPRPDDVDLVAVGEALDLAALEVLTYDARTVVDAYLDQLAVSDDASCPEVAVDPSGNRYWFDGCIANDGSLYSGFLFYYPQTDASDGTFVFSGDTVSGNARVLDSAGRAIDIQGTASFLSGTAVDGTSNIVVSTLQGGFGLDAAPPGWLAAGPQSADLTILGLTFTGFPGAAVEVAGAVVVSRGAGDAADGTYAVEFTGNRMVSGPLSPCDSEPGGTVAVRDAAGRWIDIAFDGPTDDGGADPAACDGCGRASRDGVELGLVCADFFPWLTWEALP